MDMQSRGAAGEEEVGRLLAGLGEEVVVNHDMESPYGNIDHIVYDKRGNIFLIETKAHMGRVSAHGDQLLLNGHAFEKDILAQTLSNCYWLKEKLENEFKVNAWITPVLVFTKAFVEFGKPIRGVTYLNKKYLAKFIRERKAGSQAGLKLWERWKEKQGYDEK